MATSTSKMQSVKAQSGVTPWLYNPALDLIVGCGAWSAPLLLLAYFGGSSTLGWSVAFYALALVFNYPHYMATIYRAYHTSEDFHKYRIFTVHITALVVLTLLVGHFWYPALPWIFTLYLTWSPWHYSGQNYGLFMMFARRAGAAPTVAVRRAAYAAFLLSYLALAVSFHTGASSDPLFLSLQIPERVSSGLLLTLVAGFAAVSVYALRHLIGQCGWKPLLPSLTLFSTQFMWFLLPSALVLTKGLPVTQSRYSNGVFAIMHSAQYLWITSYYARREAQGDKLRAWRPFAYFAVLVAGGIALFVPGPWLASRVFHYDFTASFLLFTALVNIHHFILDGAIWKLRDGRIASLLLNSRLSRDKGKDKNSDQISQTAGRAGRRVASAARWLAGGSSGARSLRWSAALLLLALGTVDEARYYWSLHQESLADLQQATALNAFDSSVQLRLGKKELEAGNAEEAVAAWQRAVLANPAEVAPRTTLLKYLTTHKRFDEAYSLTSEALHYSPRDPDLLVNHGVLAQQQGHFEEAAASWTKAIAVDRRQSLAHLYLANELDREGKPAAAIPHYMAFLELMAKAGVENRPRAEDVIAVVLRLAQSQQKAAQPDPARQSYDLAQRLARQAGNRQLESLASIGRAALETEQKNIPAALQQYQQALSLDAAEDDRRSEASDWYSYAQFLRANGFPPRLTYACLVKSESLIPAADKDSEIGGIEALREETEKAVPAALRRDPQPLLREALALSGPQESLREPHSLKPH